MAFRYQYKRLSKEPESADHDNSRPKDAETEASFISRLFLLWIDGLFWLGCRRSIEHSDLYAHPRVADSERLLNTFCRYWKEELTRKKCGGEIQLWWVILKCLWWRIMLAGTLTAFQCVVLGDLVQYFSIEDPTGEETRNVYIYATVLVVTALLGAVNYAHASLFSCKNAMILKVLLTAALYHKALCLDPMSLQDVSIGHVITLASNDVQRFDWAFLHFHYIWVSVVSLVASTYLIYLQIEWTAFLCVIVIVILLPLQVAMTCAFTEVRLKSAHITSDRIKVMKEVVTGMRVIKMYAWEYAFEKMVNTLRRKESWKILQSMWIEMTNVFFTWITFPYVLTFIVFVVYASLGGELTPKKVFTTLAVLGVMASHLRFSVAGILQLADAIVGIRRIEAFLKLDDLVRDPAHGISASDPNSGSNHQKSVSTNSKVPTKTPRSTTSSSIPFLKGEDFPFVRLTHVSAVYGSNSNKLVLENVSLEINRNSSRLAVVGPVGCGKSTLLQCVLGELRPVQGTVEVCGTISYACQVPWVFSGTLRDNVLFGLPFEKDLYNTVIQACCLEKDIELLPDGDQSYVGEMGVTLSGGQKARVTLARAVYREADVYLLDNPLSAVDTEVAKQLFENVICGLLRNKLVMLVTHHVHYALQCDQVLELDNGKVTSYGAPSVSALMARELTDEQKAGSEFVIRDQEDEATPGEPEDSEGGGQHLGESAVETATQEGITTPTEEGKSHGSVSWATYYRFFRAGGSHLFLLFVAVLFISGEASVITTDLWLSDWTDCLSTNTSAFDFLSISKSTCELSQNNRIKFYSGLIGFAILWNFVKTATFGYLCVNCSRVLHNKMFKAVLRSPIRFFDTCPSGQILNRFSMDVGLLDKISLQYNFFLLHFLRLVSVILIAIFSNYFVLIPALIFVVVTGILRQYYLKTSREIKRLEAVARSPLYSHLSTTLQGLPTIRVFGRESVALALFQHFQNRHTQTWWLYVASVRWLSMRVDILSALFLALVAFTSIPLSSMLDAGLVGLGLTYTISLADKFQFCVRLSAELENYMVSAERVLEYGGLEPEASLESHPPLKEPPPGWPDRGRIELDSVSFRYASNLPITLHSLTLTINPEEKVGIIGRTGAGKSSLLSVLFRLAEPLGKVTIDGVDIQDIGLHDLRRNISIIPQDPVLFCGTVRYNLDPFDCYSDEDLWIALEQVRLKLDIEELKDELGSYVPEGGSNFSVGQRQLICLARALLRKSKILVLDEATANVDTKTDAVIQQIIRESFNHCTVLTIAHRLDTVMDADKILVMERGHIAEFSSPYLLLQDPQSRLRRMVDQTGPTAANKLYQMAADAHRTGLLNVE